MATDEAIPPPTGNRKRITFDAPGGYSITLDEAPPRTGLRAGIIVLAVFGPALAGLISGAGMKIGDERYTWPQLVAAGAHHKLIEQMMVRLDRLDPDDADRMLVELTVGRCWVTGPSMPTMFVRTAAHLDELLPSAAVALLLLRHAVEVNLHPISPAPSTSDVGRADATSTTPAATP